MKFIPWGTIENSYIGSGDAWWYNRHQPRQDMKHKLTSQNILWYVIAYTQISITAEGLHK